MLDKLHLYALYLVRGIISALLLAFVVVALMTVMGCSDSSARAVVRSQPVAGDLLVEAVAAQRQVVAAVRADIQAADAQLTAVNAEIAEIEQSPGCQAMKPAKCNIGNLESVRADLEEELAELHEELRVQGNKLQQLIDQLAKA